MYLRGNGVRALFSVATAMEAYPGAALPLRAALMRRQPLARTITPHATAEPHGTHGSPRTGNSIVNGEGPLALNR